MRKVPRLCLAAALFGAACESSTPLEATTTPAVSVSSSTSSSAERPCEDDQRRSYGQEPPGLWLTDVLLQLGAPGGYSLTERDVRDTGTALWIDIPQYDNDPTMYATMLTPGTDPNITFSPPEKEIGREGSYTLYFQEGNPWQSYKARSNEWQLALIAYPGAGNHEVQWPAGTVKWLRAAAREAQQSPPQCDGPIT